MGGWSKVAAWVVASRPRTLVASLSPVCIGASLALREVDEVSWILVCLCLAFAMFIQVGANFANDYYDFVKGADDERRLGPARSVASGVVSPSVMRMVAFGTLSFGFALGLFLMELSGAGWPLLLVGVASVFCALAYTAGPWPLAYLGLGDVFVVLFFGLVATGVTHYVLVHKVGLDWIPVWWAGLAVGLIVNNLLVVNNHRDAEEDAACGKRTLVARFGRKFGVALYLLGSCVALGLCPWYERGLLWTAWLLPVALFLGLLLNKAKSQKDYAKLLGRSAALVIAHCILAVAGLLILR
jgi:1,4-dihydroxy-2-naphthoate polyprenyltransferase